MQTIDIYIVFMCPHRYMVALEDTLTFAMCGLFVIILAALCFIAFSAVTVEYSLPLGQIMIVTTQFLLTNMKGGI
jgi:hypothetical protein